MNPFRSYTLTWWEIGIFKAALFSIGAAVGAHWHAFFNAHQTIVIAVAVATSTYLIYIMALRQQR